jgi:hypothetical protein
LIEPECVVQHTRQYEEEHDQWKEFRDMHLVHRPGRCVWTELRTPFICWAKKEINQNISKEDAKSYFVKHLGPFDPKRGQADPTGGTTFKGWNDWHFVAHVSSSAVTPPAAILWWTEHMVRQHARTLTEVLPGESSPAWLLPRRFDIECNTINLFIEVDGEQHFQESSRFPGCFRERQRVDAWKMRRALENGFSVVRVAQADAASTILQWTGESSWRVSLHPKIAPLGLHQKYST